LCTRDPDNAIRLRRAHERLVSLCLALEE
jgi:hypothetical protein